MYELYSQTKWKEDGTEYGEKEFNNIEKGIKNLETYARYREIQTINMGKAIKKLRTNKDVIIGMRGDSVMYGYNTITGGEEGIRRYPNDVPADGGDDGAMRDRAIADGYDGCFYYGQHPLKRGSGSYEIKGNNAANRTEVQVMDVMIQCLNEVFEGHITYSDKVFTGDSAIINYYRYNASGADICFCNLGINDALAGFLGADYVGNVEEFVYWYKKIIERELDNGTAFVIVTPVLQTTVSSYDTDARTVVDVYEKILYDIGRNYNIPVINGNELNHNFNNNLIIDFTHFTCAGNESVGKRLAATLITGDIANHITVTDGDMIGVRPQEDYVNVYGNACVDYTDKSPSYACMLDNNDLYDTGVNRIAKGLGIFLNYNIDGVVKDLYDESLLNAMELETLNQLLSITWEDPGQEAEKETAIEKILQKQNDYILNEITEDVNVLWRQADLYARGKGKRGSNEYKNAFSERMEFLKGKHGNGKVGKVTWSFYCDRDGMVVIPSLYTEKEMVITMELDFASIVPEKNGYYLTLKTVEELQAICDELEISYNSEGKDELIELIKAEKGYDKPGFEQSSPTDIFDWTGSEEVDYGYSEKSIVDFSVNGYHNKSNVTDGNIKIVSKGWHTITLYSKDNEKFLAFGLQFLHKNNFKES